MQKRKLLSVLVGQAVAAAATVAVPVYAQDSGQATERVTITGSSIKRTLEDQALPVTIMTREDIERSGAVNIEQLVQAISSSQSSGATTGAVLAGSASYGESTVSLRGLGGNRTLVLVNGRRMSPFANDTVGAVDINAIPLAAVERVEVLTDGASSVYGSDAVAGVMNFILRQNFQGAEVAVEEGTPTRSGGGQSHKMSATVGKGDFNTDGYNVMLTLSQKKEDALFAKDRSFSKTGNVPPYLTSSATPSGKIEGVWDSSLSPTANKASASNPYGISSSGYGNPAADMPGGCASINMFPVGASPAAGTGTNCNFDSAPFVGLFPASTDQSAVGTVKIKLNPQNQFFAEAMWNSNELTETYQPSPVRFSFLSTDTAFAGTNVQPLLLITPSNPNYPGAWLQSHGLSAMDGKTLGVTARTFLTGPRTERDTNDQGRIVLGLNGTINNWDYEVALNHDRNTSHGKVVDGYFSQFQLANIINTVGNTAGTYWNPWAPGGVQNAALTTALAASQYTGATATSAYNTTALDAKISGTLMDLPSGPLAVAAGILSRKEDYKVDVPDILGLGDIAGLGGATLSQSGSRNVNSIFGEANFPVLTNLEANASVRLDHYNDLKQDASPVTGKLSARWTPTPMLAVRASVGSGFRAPSLAELHRPQSVGTSEQFVDPLFPDQGPVQVNAMGGGNDNLKPEKTNQQSLGLVLTPTRDLTARVDYWRIKIRDMILAPAALAQINAARAGGFLYHAGEVSFNPDGSVDQVDETLQNAGTANMEGIDLGLHWRNKFSFGALSTDYSGTYMTKADLQTLVGTEHSIGALVDGLGNPLTLPGTGVILRYKHTLSVNWSIPDWSVTLAQNYNAGYATNVNQVDGAPHSVSAFATYDAQVEYSALKHVRLALGVRNLFDKDPNLYIPAANFFQYGYDPSLYDPRARFVYAKAVVKF